MRMTDMGRRIKVLWGRQEYLDMILAGRKTVEVRVAYTNLTRLHPGDLLLLNEQHTYEIVRISRYAGFEGLLAEEDTGQIAPDSSPAELLAILRELYPPEKEALGVLAIEITRHVDNGD